MSSPIVRFFPIDSRWTPPSRATSGSAGFDLYAFDNLLLLPQNSVSISTKTGVVIPENCAGVIRSRSGLAFRHNIHAFHGTIDSDYTGEIKVLLFNHSTSSAYSIKRGDRIAQLVIVPCITEAELIMFAPPTERSDSGFGSTGV